MSRGIAGQASAAGVDGSPPGLAVRRLESWRAAGQLLSASTLRRLCGNDIPTEARQAQLALSGLIVATYQDEAIGFVAYKRGAGSVRVAQELWVDTHAQCGVAAVVGILLRRLEQESLRSRCDKLFIVVPQNTPLRRILQTEGYAITLEGADLLYLEKTFPRGTSALRM